MKKRLYEQLVRSIIEHEGKNITYDSEPHPFHSHVIFILEYKKKKYKIIVFIDGVLDDGYRDFDYIDSILLNDSEVFDFDYLYKNKLCPFTWILKWVDDKQIEKYFHDAYKEFLRDFLIEE